MSLNAKSIIGLFRQRGLRVTIISVLSVIAIGVVDQFTARIVPAVIRQIDNFIDPPKFFIRFVPPEDLSGSFTVSSLDVQPPQPVSFKESDPGSRIFTVLADLAIYLLRLRGTTSKAGKELVDNTHIQNSGDIWKVDTGERNWADARALTDAVPDAIAPLPNAAPGRLSETRWPAAAPDFMLLASVGDTTLRSILANALVEAGVFENGSGQEKRRIVLFGEQRVATGRQRYRPPT